jgi:hypothetical protein
MVRLRPRTKGVGCALAISTEDWGHLGVADVVALRSGDRPRLVEVKSTRRLSRGAR